MRIKMGITAIFAIALVFFSGCGRLLAPSSNFKITIDEKVTVYNLEQRIRAGATDEQLSKAAIDVLVTGDNLSVPARIYEMSVEGEDRTTLLLHLMCPPSVGVMGIQVKNWDMNLLVDNTPEAKASRKGERLAIDDSLIWDMLLYKLEYGGLNLDESRQVQMSQRTAIPFGFIDGKEVRLFKLRSPFPHAFNVNINRQTLRVAPVQAGILWGDRRPYNQYDFTFNGRSGSFYGIKEKCVLFFVGTNNQAVGHAARYFSVADTDALSRQSQDAFKRYPALLKQARKMASQP
jgi:hypothetical protein